MGWDTTSINEKRNRLFFFMIDVFIFKLQFMLTDPDGHFAWMVLNAGFAAYDGYKAYKKNGWKAAAVAVGAGLVGGAAYKGAKLAYNTFKYGTKLKFTNITRGKSIPNFGVNVSLRQLHNRLNKTGWDQEIIHKNGLQIRNFTKNGGGNKYSRWI
ncbi:hypothetical protein [Bacillus cereus]|uniref:hypothetical protein n=1 Tax=Bacillus cereus group TaxID=86661 RepID=UPI001F385B19|nr:hypothetical protein [Bacillus thuringiensis]